jgi:hypothetical protein
LSTDLLPIAPDVIICIPTIKSGIDSKMLTKTAPMIGDAIIMTDRAIEIAPATILNILDALTFLLEEQKDTYNETLTNPFKFTRFDGTLVEV